MNSRGSGSSLALSLSYPYPYQLPLQWGERKRGKWKENKSLKEYKNVHQLLHQLVQDQLCKRQNHNDKGWAFGVLFFKWHRSQTVSDIL